MLYHQTKHTNLPRVLLLQDRNAMAHGVESRVPYLDHRLVEFCFRLPASYKVGAGERKRILRHVGRAYLPRRVVERQDKQAIVSSTRWMPLRQPPMAEALRAMAHSTTMARLPWVHAEALRRFVAAYLANQHNDALAVWRLYTAWRWLELFRPSVDAEN